LTLLEAVLRKKNEGVMVWIDEKWSWLHDLEDVKITQIGGDERTLAVVIQPMPLNDLPPYVISDEEVTITDLENGISTVVANLPLECQKLYANVAGPKIQLNTDDFKEFGDAIERSVTTQGCLGWKLLKKKDQEFGKSNFEGTYLRITIGRDAGDSPGVPYVLEIWPAGHYSPIHDHGNSYAVIKVLYGTINAYYFDSIDKPDEKPRQSGSPAELREGDITWISKDNYQIHQLRNESTGVCCTLQCYKYGDSDRAHYEYFRYISSDDTESIGKFEPDSDMPFGEFKQAIKEEWEDYKRSIQA